MAWFRKPKYTTIRQQPESRDRVPKGFWVKCEECLELITQKEWDENSRVCPKCSFHHPLGAPERLQMLLDPGSFEEFDSELVSADPLAFVDSKPYPQRIADARKKTGLNDAVVAGLGRIEGRPLSIAVMDFRFNGGSMGSVVGEKIARALERGIEGRLPVVIVCASGGARMQEGILSLMQMAKTSALIARLGQAGLPYISVLTHPTTAGVMASFAMLGDVCLAEPGSLIAFAGPRVIEATIKQTMPPGFQKAEFVHAHGFIDRIVTRMDLRGELSKLICWFMDAEEAPATGNGAHTARRKAVRL